MNQPARGGRFCLGLEGPQRGDTLQSLSVETHFNRGGECLVGLHYLCHNAMHRKVIRFYRFMGELTGDY
jgi:hypothetical protein